MSGVFLVVFSKEALAVLPATKGGHPHITVFYSGTRLDVHKLSTLASRIFRATLVNDSLRSLTLRAAGVRVNSFYEETTARMRYDVLIDLEPADAALIERLRDEYVPTGITFHKPRITHSIHYESATASMVAASLESKLPISVDIVGVTID